MHQLLSLDMYNCSGAFRLHIQGTSLSPFPPSFVKSASELNCFVLRSEGHPMYYSPVSCQNLYTLPSFASCSK